MSKQLYQWLSGDHTLILKGLRCRLGLHNIGIVGRHYSGDGPEFEVLTCNRCGREFGFATPEPPDQKVGEGS